MRSAGPARRHGAHVLVALVVGLLLAPLLPPRAAGAEEVRYEPPVAAPVVDPFRLDGGPYGPGNRGLEYGTAAGTPVRAAADGTVTFAGSVAGARHVTVRHADGVRTSYSFLDEVHVVRGQEVRRGQVLGTTAGHLHLGARRGDAYFDPATLFAGGPPRVYLVPFEAPPGRGVRGERRALAQFVAGVRRVGGALAGGAVTVGGEAVEAGAAVAGAAGRGLRAGSDLVVGSGRRLVRTFAHYAQTLGSLGAIAAGYARASLRALEAWRRACTPDAVRVAPPARPASVVLVGGLGSSSRTAAIDEVDLDGLGYDPANVLRFSYAGGRVPDERRGAALAGIDERAYEADDTLHPLPGQGRALADLVEAVAEARPGAPVDLLAHSQGGVVARLAVAELVARHGPDWVREHVGFFATVATPHGGADLATAANALDATRAGHALLELAALRVPLDADSPAVAQLSEVSDVIDHLRRRPLPRGIRNVSVAARADPVVAVPRTRARGMRSVTVPIDDPRASHSALPGDPRTTRELLLAREGRPPRCVGLGTALADELTGQSISVVEDAVGAAALVQALRTAG